MKKFTQRGFLALAATFIFPLLGASIHLVAPYNADDQTEITAPSKDVFNFYQNLMITPPTDRQFSKSKKDYAKIDTEMRVLILRESAVDKNQNSIDLSNAALSKWESHRTNHQKHDGNSDADLKIDRNDFQAAFQSLLKNEESKKLAAGTDK